MLDRTKSYSSIFLQRGVFYIVSVLKSNKDQIWISVKQILTDNKKIQFFHIESTYIC